MGMINRLFLKSFLFFSIKKIGISESRYTFFFGVVQRYGSCFQIYGTSPTALSQKTC
jgi:hypothetical protein